MRAPLLYRMARAGVSVAVRAYFRRLEVSGARNVPDRGPVILAANHPQSITDALVLGLAAGRMVSYLAHSGLFRNPVKRHFLTRCGVIPVYRPTDVSDAQEKNVEVFASCYELLDAGGVIGIFPEGTSGQERRMGRLKTGAARIALQFEAQRNWNAGVVLVPAGINFESRGRFRSRVLVSFGNRIHVSDYRDEYEADRQAAVARVTGAIDEGIRRRVVDIGHAEYERMVRDIETVYRDEILERNAGREATANARIGSVEKGGVGERRHRVSERRHRADDHADAPSVTAAEGRSVGASEFKRAQAVSREIPRAIEFFLETRPETVWTIRAALREYLRKLERLKLSDETLRGDAASVRRAAQRFATRGLLGLPLAAWGGFWNAIPYKLTGLLARRAAPDLTQLHFYQLIFGALLYAAWYPPLLYGAWQWVGLRNAVIFAATLVPSGFFARWYGRLMAKHRKTLRLAALETRHGYYVQRVRKERAQVVRLLDAALAQYAAGAPDSRTPKPIDRENDGSEPA